MSVLIIPTSLIMAFFSEEILMLWTQNPLMAQRSHLLMFFLTFATMFNGLSHLPLSLQYAHGETRIIFNISLVTMMVMAPAIYLTTKFFGVYGAAVSLMGIFLFHILTLVHFIHRQSLPGEERRWYVQDVGYPMLSSLAVVGGAWLLLNSIDNTWVMIGGISTVTLMAVAMASLAATEVRRLLVHYFNGFREKIPHGR